MYATSAARSVIAASGVMRRVALASAVSLLMVGCSGSQSALDPRGPQAARIASEWWLFFWVATAVFVAVAGVLLYAVARARRGQPTDAPEGEGTGTAFVAGGALLTVLILFVFLVYSTSTGRAITDLPDDNPLTIEVIGHQWWWEVRYLDADPSRLVTTANEIHIPVGRPVRFRVTARDVIHSFWVPNLHGKIDLIPGQDNRIWLQADEAGVFRGQCAEFCGLQHALMAFLVVAQPPEEFASWLEQQRQPAAPPAEPIFEHGQEVFLRSQCVLCHTIRGTEAFSQVGPDLTHVGSRRTLAAATIPNTRGSMAAWIVDPQHIKPGNLQRAPGMSLNRMPLFVWSILVTAFMIMFAMPPLMVTSVMLALDRTVGTHFFNPALGGEPLLWQHVFWFFGHPEVYVIFLPALGMVSSIVVTFSRGRIFGYTAIVLALVATGFIAFGLWVHHMFATGLSPLGMGFFTAASMMIAIPSGIQIFCWIITLWNGKLVLKTSLWFIIGFVLIFVLGGLTGVMLASVPFDLQVHDTFFVVAHFHYVLIGGAVFPLFGALYYWFPKFTGRFLDERLGQLNFWSMFVGFNLTFFPMHQLGFMGMPRRVYTYLEDMGWGNLNLLATIGAFLIALSVLVFLWNALTSSRRGEIAGDNPWGADTLEWGTTSPPPNYNFRHLPTVHGRYALWDRRPAEEEPVVVGLRADRREVLITTLMDAEPDYKSILPAPSIWPLLLALAISVAFIGLIFDVIWVPIGALLALGAFIGWHWPVSREQSRDREEGEAA